MPMNKYPQKPGHNILRLPTKARKNQTVTRDFPDRAPAPGGLAAAGSPDDPRMQEAIRLVAAFLAIEDAAARDAMIALAESLVTQDWVRKAQQR